MKILSKKDYLALGKRRTLNTTLREDIHIKLGMLCAELNENASKCLDVLLLDILNDPEKLRDFKNKIRTYR